MIHTYHTKLYVCNEMLVEHKVHPKKLTS